MFLLLEKKLHETRFSLESQKKILISSKDYRNKYFIEGSWKKHGFHQRATERKEKKGKFYQRVTEKTHN